MLLPVDGVLSSYDPTAHGGRSVPEQAGLRCPAQFPLTTLSFAERLRDGGTYSRQTWGRAAIDLTLCSSRASECAAAHRHGAECRRALHRQLQHLSPPRPRRKWRAPVPQGRALIAHWNLRDGSAATTAKARWGASSASDRQGDGAYRRTVAARRRSSTTRGSTGILLQHRRACTRHGDRGGRARQCRGHPLPSASPHRRRAGTRYALRAFARQLSGTKLADPTRRLCRPDRAQL